MSQFTRLLLKTAWWTERLSAYAQGKGYGTASIEQENALTHKLLRRRPALAIDIGANVGDYTAELRRRNPSLEIHAFEPATVNVHKLKARFGGDPLIHIQPCAVSSESGSATLHGPDPGSGLSSLAHRRLDHIGIPFENREQVNTIRFEDYWINTLNRRHLDIVKIDIEGFELAALHGAGEAIANTSVLQFEFGGCNIDTRTFFQDFWYFFHENGFALYRITPIGLDAMTRYRELDEFFSTTNFIAARP